MKKKSAIKAAFWSIAERVSTQAVSFVIGIILARLLSPNDYGTVGLTAIFIALSNVFIDSGFANGLIRKKEPTESDLSTAFYFNVVVGIVVYILLCICSPFIASFFDTPILEKLLKIVGLNVVFNSLCIVQTAILTANLNIKLQTTINISAQVPAGIIAIILAYYGFGVYSLVLQSVCSSFFKVILLWLFAKWRPKEKFNRESFNYLWGFGSKLLFANLIGSAFNQIYSVLIGKFIGKVDLGFYSKGSHLNDNINGVTTGLVQKIALPVLARYQEDNVLLCNKFRDLMRCLVMALAPLSAVLCFASKDIIITLWSEKWLSSAVIFQYLVIGTMFIPIGHMSLTVMQVCKRTDLILKLEFPKKIVYIIFLVIGFKYSIMGLVVANVFINITGALINMWATKKILPYNYLTQIFDLSIYILLAYTISFVVSFCAVSTSHIVNILIVVALSTIMYVISLVFIKDRVALKYLNNYLLVRLKHHEE